MRNFIKICGGGFVLLGMATMALTALAAFKAFSLGADPTSSLGLGFVGAGLLIAIVGFFAGASLTLVGGAAYLLASIDHRLEMAATRTAKSAPSTVSFDVGEGSVPAIV